jgi:hypothetical protein
MRRGYGTPDPKLHQTSDQLKRRFNVGRPVVNAGQYMRMNVRFKRKKVTLSTPLPGKEI